MNRAEIRYSASVASPGVAVGPVVRVGTPDCHTPKSGDAGLAQERFRLERAIDQAALELKQLTNQYGEVVAGILAFQLEALNDDSLLREVEVMLAMGVAAETAWRNCMARYIAECQAAADETFRSHASDYLDVRDRVARAFTGENPRNEALPEGAIVFDVDLTPSRFLGFDRSRLAGIVLMEGSPSGHVAVMARANGVPMLCGLERDIPGAVNTILDAGKGQLIVEPSAETAASYAQRIRHEYHAAATAASSMFEDVVTRDGKCVDVMVNVDDPATVTDSVLAAADGVGLVRTEALFYNAGAPPDEQTQFDCYAALLARLEAKDCIIFRTFDVGGDKPGVAGSSGGHDAFLGMRGIRRCLDAPDRFRLQLRALLRLAVDERVSIMLPMISVCEEYQQTRALLEDCLAALHMAGQSAAMPNVGIMVETPAAAIAVDTIDADFFCIGGNDLTQFTMAAARDGLGRLARLNEPGQTAVLRLIRHVVHHAQSTGRGVSFCGDVDADSAVLGALLTTGLQRLSVAPAALARVKQCIRRLDLGKYHGPTAICAR